MGLIEEVQELKQSGAQEDKITAILQERGYPIRIAIEIYYQGKNNQQDFICMVFCCQRLNFYFCLCCHLYRY